MLLQCAFCSMEIKKSPTEINRTKNSFCSKKCSNTFYRAGKQPNPPKIRTCKTCGQQYTNSYTGHQSLRFCPSCKSSKDATRGYPRPARHTHNEKREQGLAAKENQNHYMSITLEQLENQLHLKGKHPSWLHAQVRGFARSWNKSMLKLPCAICRYTLHVELCHLDPITGFSKTATLGEVNHSTNLIQLCRNHHWEFDHDCLEITKDVCS